MRGVQTVTYADQALEDLSRYPNDAFQIGHIKVTNLSGVTLTGQDYTWGENNRGKQWDSSSHTWKYQFVWGSIGVQFIQDGDTLNIKVTESNRPDSGVIVSGASIAPFILRFPVLPKGFVDPTYSQLAINSASPSVTLADFGVGEVASVAPDAAKAIYSGFLPSGTANAYVPLISSTTPDNLPTFQPRSDHPVKPGETDTFVVSLRFAPSGTPIGSLAADAFASWAATWPQQIRWSDKRAIGTIYLGSSVSGDIHRPSGFPNNPRRYLNESNPDVFDVRTATGLAKFQKLILGRASDAVTNMQRLKAQGAITWDLEGDEYPMDTTYLCSPEQIGKFAPEMESTISDGASPYQGMRLVDAYFKIMTSAGFRVGVCVRPQQLTLNSDGSAQQTYIPNDAVAAQLIGKMKYAHDRWGATLFYIDSSVDSQGGPIDAAVMQQAAAALPDSLLIPEESTPKDYGYVAPFRTFLFHGDLGTDPFVRNFYPNAFSAVLINDVDSALLAAHRVELTASVKQGDILMAHVDYWQANNPVILQMYEDAGVSTSTTAPVPPDTAHPAPGTGNTGGPTGGSGETPAVPDSPVVITLPMPGDTVSGVGTVSATINLNLDAAASFLLVDGVERGIRRVGNAPFTYQWVTTDFADGVHLLQVSAHSVSNITSVSQAVSVVVSNHSASSQNPPPVSAETGQQTSPVPVTQTSTPGTQTSYPIEIISPVSGQALSGKAQVTAKITQPLDAAGSYLMVDGQEWGTRRVSSAPYIYDFDATALPAGTHQLQVWAHDIGNNTLLSNTVEVSVP